MTAYVVYEAVIVDAAQYEVYKSAAAASVSVTIFGLGLRLMTGSQHVQFELGFVAHPRRRPRWVEH